MGGLLIIHRHRIVWTIVNPVNGPGLGKVDLAPVRDRHDLDTQAQWILVTDVERLVGADPASPQVNLDERVVTPPRTLAG